jgi:hypothetical protein
MEDEPLPSGVAGDHEGRLRKLERADARKDAAIQRLTDGQDTMRAELFGVPGREDSTSRGAFYRVEESIHSVTVSVAQQIGDLKGEIKRQVDEVKTVVDDHFTDETALRAEREKRKGHKVERKWQFLIGVGVAVFLTVGSYLMQFLPHP